MTDIIPTRVALVTGASGGIGRAVAQRLAQDGFAVAVHYAGNKTAADAVVDQVRSAGGRAIAVGGDVADEVAMAGVFDAVASEFGGVDVVVHTAGVMRLGPIATVSLDDVDAMHRTNIRGTFVVDQLAAQRVRTGGAIVNFSTTVTRTQFPTYGAYVASKAAVEGMTMVLARELRGRDITVNAVAPGPVMTELYRNNNPMSAAQRQELEQRIPLKRLGEPEDIAGVIAFFLSADARFVTGQVLYACGGLSVGAAPL